jgi:hypothetical protein
MRRLQVAARESAEDLFFGQVVIIWARWFIIAAAALLSLWGASSEGELAGSIVLVVALMGVNFFLHARHLASRPANQLLVTAASVLDLALVTFIVLAWHGQSGIDSRYFVFYYPLVFSFALVFPPRMAGSYAGLTLATYVAACVAADPSILFDTADAKLLVMRLITLGAMGGLGAYYWRIQRDRRRTASTLQAMPLRSLELG